MSTTACPNRLQHETSPYLIQHAYNPVDWFPWGSQAFEKAKAEDKPVFLSIGYSTCHWCHLMARESFEDEEIADILNQHFVSIKVDKEERPDIDSIYMAVCQAFTGSGGWPTTIFMTPDQKPFFAGTYFPKTARYGMVGFAELLHAIKDGWENNRDKLLKTADKIIAHLSADHQREADPAHELLEGAFAYFQQTFDKKNGGFGRAPKFPTPHNLLFLLRYFDISGDPSALEMVETTLIQMYKGGIFDHFGFGFSRYSTDQFFLVPHFEKMLYDNALLMIAYAQAYAVTKQHIYKEVAEKIATYVLREMTSPQGGFYSAQDADSEGVEGKYYVFDYEELPRLLGDTLGEAVGDYYGITKKGNFEGKNIPNLLHNKQPDGRYDSHLPTIYEYRKQRTKLHLDDKVLTSWNAMMITAFTMLYRVTLKEQYLQTAQQAYRFIQGYLMEQDTLFVSYRDGARSGKGFLDDYAYLTLALIQLYEATLEEDYLQQALKFCQKAIRDFYDTEKGGFFLYGKQNEQLIIQPKETYDGAVPSGNSVMAYNLVKLMQLTEGMVLPPELQAEDISIPDIAAQQLSYLAAVADGYPAGYSFYLLALSLYLEPPKDILVVLRHPDEVESLKGSMPLGANVRLLYQPTQQHPLLNNQTTFYVCHNHSCLPPTNDIKQIQA